MVSLPARKDGKLDVGGALDLGVLTVIKDIGMKEPYSDRCSWFPGNCRGSHILFCSIGADSIIGSIRCADE